MATQAVAQKRQYTRSGGSLLPRGHRSATSLGSGILDEYYFLHLLRLERKRTERTSRPFMLMLLDGGVLFHGLHREELMQRISATVADAIRETDTLGWYEYGRQLGVIFSEIGDSVAINSSAIAGKIIKALQQSLGPVDFDSIELTFRIFPEEQERLKQDPDFTFYPDLAAHGESRTMSNALKRTLDVVGSIIALLLFAPLFLAIALAVKFTSEGPILFRQRRVGQFGKPFTFLKFRSMHANNDPKIHQEYVAKLIAGKDGLQQSGKEGGVFKLTNDPRITPIGRLLRKTSLDELPQFLNVLSGQMSLVGPRPPVPYEFEAYHIWHRRRVLEVKPGITGLWQVHGRSKTTFDEMVRLDLRYAKVWSLWLDLKILLKTPAVVLLGDGAY